MKNDYDMAESLAEEIVKRLPQDIRDIEIRFNKYLFLSGSFYLYNRYAIHCYGHTLRGKRFESITEIQSELEKELANVKLTGERLLDSVVRIGGKITKYCKSKRVDCGSSPLFTMTSLED